MAKCPKCSAEIYEKATKCPNCQTTISSIIQNTESNPIPLKVKPVKSPKPLKQIKEKTTISELDKLKLYSTIKIVIVSVLLVINVFLIVNIALKMDSNEKTINKNNISNSIKKNTASSEVIGSWRTSNEGLFTFQDDMTFYWYDSYKYLDNNYYGGTYNYKQGEEALVEMGYTKEEFIKTFGEDVKLENVYSMNLIPTIAYKGGNDTTAFDINKNESWWYILIVKNDNTALGYNKTLDIRYNLIKN